MQCSRKTKWFNILVGALTLSIASYSAIAAQKIVIQNGSPVPAAAYLDYYVAEEAGYFDEEGLDVEIRYSQGAPQATQIAASGGSDMGHVAIEPYLYGYDNGMRGKYYFNATHYNIFFIGVPEDSNIKEIADLKGKHIGVSNMGSGSLIVARSMLRGAGIEPDSAMFRPVGVGDSALQALRSGNVQALAFWDGGFAGLEQAGVKLRYLHHPDIGFVGNGGLFISDALFPEHEDTAVRLTRALIKARLFIQENPDAALKIYWKTTPGSQSGKSEHEAYERGMKEIQFMSVFTEETDPAEIGRFDMNGISRYLEVMREEGVLKSDLKADDVVSNAVLDQVGDIDVAAVRAKARSWK